MLNEFVSVVISGNEEHRKLMEMTCLVKRQLPVALIEVAIFNKQDKHTRRHPGDKKRRELYICVGVQYVIDLCELRLRVCVYDLVHH